MNRLSASDASLIHGESAEWHLHVTSLLILDASTMPRNYVFAAFRDALARRLRAVPRFRQRVAEVPLGLDRPVWLDGGPFDAEAHIRRVSITGTGRPAVFEVAAAAAASKLPHDRPLWEMLVVEDSSGRLEALVVKNHHALFDGVAGLESMQTIFDLTADAVHDVPTGSDLLEEGQPGPSAVALLARSAIRGLVVQPVESLRVGRQLVRQAGTLGQAILGGSRPRFGFDAPDSPFDGKITAARALAGASLSLPAVKEIRRHAGVTVNDVLMAVIGGALRDYLDDRAHLPRSALLANVALSTRAPDDATDVGNKFSVMLMTLGTDVADPVERLQTIHADGVLAKSFAEGLAAHRDTSLSAVAPPVVVDLLGRLYRAARLGDVLKVIGNVGVSNVAGPPIPLYLGGAAVDGMFVFGPLLFNSTVNFTAVSNGDRIDVGITTSPTVLDDVDQLASYLPKAATELAARFGVHDG